MGTDYDIPQRQVMLEWFLACEELRDAIEQGRSAADIDTAACKVQDHLGRVIFAYHGGAKRAGAVPKGP